MTWIQNTLISFIRKIIKPHANISDPEDRYRSRLLNSLLVIYTPLAIFIIIFRLIVLPDTSTSTTLITLAGLGVVVIIYVVGRIGYYRASVYVTIALGYSVIYANALNSTAPHFEIAYLIFLPLLGIVMFSMREALFNYVVAMSLLFIFLSTIGDIEKEIAVDLFVFMLLTQGFIFFANYQRNRLDINRRELAIEKERAQLVKQLIDNISHDFKTPLSIIQTSLYLMERVDTPEKRKQGLAKIEKQTYRLESMIQDMLMISKLDHETLPKFSDVNLWQLISSVEKDLSSIAVSKQITIVKNLDTDIHHISGFYDELERLLFNLLVNAINYTSCDGTVNINLLLVDKDCLQLDVVDTGIGISQDDINHIFERFYRADQARSNHTGGTGLGLAIVKRIVERHNGTIHVDSKLGVGTTFSISLPISHTL